MAQPELLVVGKPVKPVVTKRQMEQLTLELYALRVIEAEDLGGFDDLNFHIKARVDDVIPEGYNAPVFMNPNIKKVANEEGYVLKIVNTHMSARPEAFDMQTKAMMHLKEQGIDCPEPIRNIEGFLFQLKTLYIEDENGYKKSSKKRIHLICLLTYMPGRVVLKHPNLKVNVFFEAGQFAGRITNALKGFDHEYFQGKSRLIWDLTNSSHLRKYTFAIPHPVRRALVSDVVDAFEKHVVPYFNGFQPGVIHGDLNAENMLFSMVKDKVSERPVIRTIIDFGDMSKSYLVFDLAICMAHFMFLDKGENFLYTGGQVLQGFSTQIAFTNLELKLLRYIVLMRYATFVTMAQYTVKMEPQNAFYVTKFLPRAWTQLKQMWEADEEEIDRAWTFTIDKFTNS